GPYRIPYTAWTTRPMRPRSSALLPPREARYAGAPSSRRASCVKEAFQKNLRGQFVYGAGALLDADAARFEHALGLDGGPPFRPHAGLDSGTFRQPSPKLPRVFGLAAFIAAHVKRQTYQKQPDVVLLRQCRKARKILADVGPLQRGQALGRNAERI